MTHTRRALLRATAGAASLALAGTALAQGRQQKIILGQSVPLTGAADQIGTAYSAGAKLFFDAFVRRY
jgi:hypothetical protein